MNWKIKNEELTEYEWEQYELFLSQSVSFW